MAKGNLFLGTARGKVGDVVFARQYGEQISRVRNRSPKNPKTPLQLAQRVILKTASGAYSLLQEIANHSFQGSQEGTPNQSRFMRRNVDILRTRMADVLNSGDPDIILSSAESNFAFKATSLAEMNPYLISEGSLVPTIVHWDGAKFALSFPGIEDISTAPTYQQVIDGLGLQRGDQLTFVMLATDDTADANAPHGKFTSMEVARVILEPSDGDYSGAFLTTGGVAHPNERNQGSIVLAWNSEGTGDNWLQISSPAFSDLAGSVATIAAAAVIISRHSGGVWQRSTQSLVVRPYAAASTGHLNVVTDVDYFGDAVLSYMDEAQSSLYLNQAESF